MPNTIASYNIEKYNHINSTAPMPLAFSRLSTDIKNDKDVKLSVSAAPENSSIYALFVLFNVINGIPTLPSQYASSFE